MANTDAAFGFKVVGKLGGGIPSIRKYYVASASANMFPGDIVKLGGTADANGISEVDVASTPLTDIPVGVVVGIVHTSKDNLGKRYIASGTNGYVYVCDDPDAILEAQDDGGGALTAASVGLNATWIAGTGSTSTGQSAYEIDGGTSTAPGAGTPATHANYELQIIGASQKQGNVVGSDYTLWLVRWNIHQYGKGSYDTNDTNEIGMDGA